MGITGSACAQAKQTFSASLHLCTLVAIGMTESFICCWDEKYRSNRIRPETAIRKYVDADWKPLLQTPPFPDYLSGHSCISATASVILSHYLGDHFSFTDSVEMPYGLPARKFDSFDQAGRRSRAFPLLRRHSLYGWDNGWPRTGFESRRLGAPKASLGVPAIPAITPSGYCNAHKV